MLRCVSPTAFPLRLCLSSVDDCGCSRRLLPFVFLGGHCRHSSRSCCLSFSPISTSTSLVRSQFLLRLMKKQNVRTLSLIVCTFTYLLVGAAVFDALESDNEMRQRSLVEKLRQRLADKYNISRSDYQVLEAITIKSIPHKAGYQWKFSGAFYFATTVITTIGYGHSTPSTVGGKIFCMFYALAGIPLGLVMFQSIGERLNTFVVFVLRFAKRGLCGIVSPQVTHMDQIVIASVCGSVLMAAGAFVFHKYEDWLYFDSLYYCFITLTTIGFGDYVALQKNSALQSHPQYVAFSLVFILFGLTIVSAAMNLLNTDDERRDERQARLAARGLVRVVDDDLIAADDNGPRVRLCVNVDSESECQSRNNDDDETSKCSCSYYRIPSPGSVRHRYGMNTVFGPIEQLTHWSSDFDRCSNRRPLRRK